MFLRATNTGPQDLVREILQNLNEISTVDLTIERNTRWIDQQGRDAMTVMQLGLQYFIFA